MRKLMLSAALLFFGSILWQCQSSETETSDQSLVSEGQKLAEAKCYSCHHPASTGDERLAPPFFAIKKHYLDEGDDLQRFTEKLGAFVKAPSIEKAKLTHAVERFGLMPMIPVADSEINAIAAFIYHTDQTKPGKHEKNTEDGDGLRKQAKSTALQAKAVLGKNLMGALQEGGATHALSFCNTRAIDLTDSMSLSLEASIKRVSDKPRNPSNSASDLEREYIAQFKSQLASGDKLQPLVDQQGDIIKGYVPIMTNGMCLQCHGEVASDIKSETQKLLTELYPADLAVGYKEGELRGMWVVEWKSKAK